MESPSLSEHLVLGKHERLDSLGNSRQISWTVKENQLQCSDSSTVTKVSNASSLLNVTDLNAEALRSLLAIRRPAEPHDEPASRTASPEPVQQDIISLANFDPQEKRQIQDLCRMFQVCSCSCILD
jgi:hypothetical protein